MNKRPALLPLAAILLTTLNAAPPPLAQTESALEPVIYTGSLEPDKAYYDGRLPHAVGVHSFQAFRANRTRQTDGSAIGYTYNHQPYLAYWKGRFYLQFLSALAHEHEPPTHTSVAVSEDGLNWETPRIAFPKYQLPKINWGGTNIAAGAYAVMHQRMGFYTAPNGRLLTLAFYGFAETPQHSPNAGNGVGRVVREIHADGTFGPIYFIRYNRHAGFNETNTSYPFYATSPDAGFVEACNALLSDKLYTLQWWEEDRGQDGFYAMVPDQVAGAAHFDANIVTSAGAGKALSWYTRPDGATVGIWKNQYSALSGDRGKTWTPIVINKTLHGDNGAKTWGQRTDDGRFVIVQARSPANTTRFPLVAMVGADGRLFDTMLCLQGEVPPRRFNGHFKPYGPQYYRGIEEGNGNPPGDHLWVTYSMNKEDIWVSRIPTPLKGVEAAPLREDFETPKTALEPWNLYVPQWTHARVVGEPGTDNHVLELRDEEPYDYVVAEKIFPSAKNLRVSFRMQAREIRQSNQLEIEVQSQSGMRPMRLRLNQHWLSRDRGRKPGKQFPTHLQQWYKIELDLDCTKQSYTLRVDGTVFQTDIPFTEPTPSFERIVFRTGPYRGLVASVLLEEGGERPSGLDTEDLPGADERVAPSVYWIDDLEARAR
jgi:hypothetical protein